MPFGPTHPLVSTAWLNEHLADDRLVLLDCRWRLLDVPYGVDAFESGHIPGARFIDLHEQLSGPPGRYGGRHPLPLPGAFQQTMEALGVDDADYVICYDDDGAGAARCWWLMQYYGHAQVAVLDGGYPAWIEQGRPVSTAPPAPRPARFTPRPDPRMIADYETVRNISGTLPIVDARLPERYRGTVEPIDVKAGHIPGAVNQPYPEMFATGLYFRTPQELEKLWEPVLARSREPIVYCGSGVTACLDILALRLAGADPLLYPGSWSDWIQHEDAPTAAP
ncbi:MAG: sulfurtransferase [Firmicutes bacterium]|nr:sulfurtransferase [Bacillota bacterium]